MPQAFAMKSMPAKWHADLVFGLEISKADGALARIPPAIFLAE
jgi:hypothetical protein